MHQYYIIIRELYPPPIFQLSLNHTVISVTGVVLGRLACV